jgi:hypothetical protein
MGSRRADVEGAALRRWWNAFWDNPPRGVLLTWATLICLAALWACSYPTPNGWILILGCFWPAAAVAVGWTAKTGSYLLRHGSWSNWIAAVPLVVLTSLTLVSFGAPLQSRWQLSESAFSTAVDEIRSGTDISADDRRIGGYDVRSVRAHEDNVYFVVRDSGFLGDDGIAYLPHGTPPIPDPIGEGVRVWHLRGPWYSFSAGW